MPGFVYMQGFRPAEGRTNRADALESRDPSLQWTNPILHLGASKQSLGLQRGPDAEIYGVSPDNLDYRLYFQSLNHLSFFSSLLVVVRQIVQYHEIDIFYLSYKWPELIP